jgi:hypothetical protein
MIELKLEVKEVELILSAMAQMPYAQVAGLISKIQQTAQEQLSINSKIES